MPGVGSLQVKAFTSRARIPVEDTAVAVVDAEGKLLALRITDRSGLTSPIALQVPQASNSQSPDTGRKPFATVNLYARADGYEQVLARGIQVFEDIITMQELSLVPLSELPGDWNGTQIFDTGPQNL